MCHKLAPDPEYVPPIKIVEISVTLGPVVTWVPYAGEQDTQAGDNGANV